MNEMSVNQVSQKVKCVLKQRWLFWRNSVLAQVDD